MTKFKALLALAVVLGAVAWGLLRRNESSSANEVTTDVQETVPLASQNLNTKKPFSAERMQKDWKKLVDRGFGEDAYKDRHRLLYKIDVLQPADVLNMIKETPPGNIRDQLLSGISGMGSA